MGEAIASPQADAIWREVLYLRKMAFAKWGMTQHRDPDCCSFNSLPEIPTPYSPQVSLVHSALPLPESSVSGSKWNFVHWPFKKLSLQLPLPGRQKPCCFSQLGVTWVPFCLWCCRLGSTAWHLDTTLLRGRGQTPWPLKYPSGTSALLVGSWPAVLYYLHTPYQSHCGEVLSSVSLQL